MRSAQMALGAAALLYGQECVAQEDDVQQCASAYEQAQVFRNAGQLTQAQVQLRVCVRDVCPDFVKVDCGQWLSDVKREMPSVVFTAEDSGGQELLDVQVTVDGTAVQQTLDGKALELDPGQHEVRFEYQGRTETQKLIVRQGEKNRVVLVSFKVNGDADRDGVLDASDACPNEAGVGSPNGCPAAPPAKKLETSNALDAPLVGAIVAGGVGVVGMGAFAVFGLKARAVGARGARACEVNNGGCVDSELNEYRGEERKWMLPANISLAVGGVGLATGVVLFLLHQSDSGQAAALSEKHAWTFAAVPTSEGGAISVQGRF